jgi:hypothetical protein
MADGTLKVGQIITSSGSGTITLGQSGETVTIPTGATITNSGTANGFPGVAGTIGFSATSSSQTIADATFAKITGWTEEFDNGSCWDNGNAKFLPTTAGKYLVYGYIQKELSSNAQLVSTAIYKNGSSFEYAWENDANFTIGRSTNHLTTSVTMNGSSDYLEFYAYANVASGTVNCNGGRFGAMLIKE